MQWFNFGLNNIVLAGPTECGLLHSYSLEAKGPYNNTYRLLRGLQLRKPILLEGGPGVGKTTLVTALAKASGHGVVRINLSEHTVSCLTTAYGNHVLSNMLQAIVN